MTLVQKALLAPLIVACAMFMESVDANVIVTALPSMARDFCLSAAVCVFSAVPVPVRVLKEVEA